MRQISTENSHFTVASNYSQNEFTQCGTEENRASKNKIWEHKSYHNTWEYMEIYNKEDFSLSLVH